MSVPRDDQNVKTILVSGGAGYLGSTMVPLFLAEGYKVTVYDIFRWGTQSLLGILHHPNLTVIKGTDADKRDYEVSYAKIKKLGHKTVTVTVDDGIRELLKIIPHLSEADLKIMKN